MGTHLKLTASDGHKFGAYRVDAAETPKGGIVVIHELFGANRHIRSVADRFAALGYVAIAPALFDRIEAGFECGYSPEEVQRAMRFVANPPIQAWMLDVAAAREAIPDVGKTRSPASASVERRPMARRPICRASRRRSAITAARSSGWPISPRESRPCCISASWTRTSR
jgi:hypothetical protein